MEKLSLFLVTVLMLASCGGQPKTSNISTNGQTNSAVNQPNSNISANNSTNKTTISEANSEVNAEMLKQIQSQQMETADPRKASNQSNQSPAKTTGSSQRQTW